MVLERRKAPLGRPWGAYSASMQPGPGAFIQPHTSSLLTMLHALISSFLNAAKLIVNVGEGESKSRGKETPERLVLAVSPQRWKQQQAR